MTLNPVEEIHAQRPKSGAPSPKKIPNINVDSAQNSDDEVQ